VAEGVEVFESIFEKIHTAANAAQKEKFEGDLKKEIKKLQRYRDQIKTWMSSNEIKDKRSLLENRKLIESVGWPAVLCCTVGFHVGMVLLFYFTARQQMEKFKAMEKELKTKAFSKEGLLMPGKVDPLEQQKEELGQWLTETVSKLTEKVDKLEFEQEQLLGAVKKTRKADPVKAERLSTVEHRLERHKWHITKLEIILRLLENGKLTVDQVDYANRIAESLAFIYTKFIWVPGKGNPRRCHLLCGVQRRFGVYRR
jgi:CCR4-NOT transcription complex subunit 3